MTTLQDHALNDRTDLGVLSLWQPWATLLVAGLKQIETRSWPTPYRWPLLIHASKHWSKDIESMCGDEPFFTTLRELGYRSPLSMSTGPIRTWRDLPRGAIVGQVHVDEVMPTEEAIEQGLSERELAFGDYSPDRYAWKCSRFVRFANPIAMKGEQRLFLLKQDYYQAIRTELRLEHQGR